LVPVCLLGTREGLNLLSSQSTDAGRSRGQRAGGGADGKAWQLCGELAHLTAEYSNKYSNFEPLLAVCRIPTSPCPCCWRDLSPAPRLPQGRRTQLRKALRPYGVRLSPRTLRPCPECHTWFLFTHLGVVLSSQDSCEPVQQVLWHLESSRELNRPVVRGCTC
jgi:hypothetical protein